jgi:hypothetical protein
LGALGLLGALPGPWQVRQQLFGLLAIAPLINYLYLGFGLALLGSLALGYRQGRIWPHQRLSQALGLTYTILAIGGFLSRDYWLATFANSYASAVVYSVIGVYFLYLGYFHRSAIEPPPANSGPSLPPMTAIPPQTTNQ